MIDLNEGRLRAWLDGELEGSEAEAVAERVERDPEVRRRVELLRARASRARELLAHLPDPRPPTERVRAALNAPRPVAASARGAGRSSLWARRSRLAQAAMLLLVFAGALSAAIPGSPVHEWLRDALGRDAAEPIVSPPTPDRAASDLREETGLTLDPEGAGVTIELSDLAVGTEIVIQLTPGTRVGVFTPSAERMEYEPGRIRAWAAEGPVRVELPADLVRADLIVNGRVYLDKRDGRMDLRVPATDSTASEIRLRAGS